MLFTEVTIGGKELKLRLDARGCVSLERKLGKSPLSIFMDTENQMPKLEDMILVFHASLQKYNKGYTEDKTYDLYDEYVEEGKVLTDFIPVIMDIFQNSGFFKIDETEVVETEKKL